MNDSLRRPLLGAALVLLTAVGCEKKLEGPQPSLSGVSPPAVCVEQLETKVTVTGGGLAPMQEKAFTDDRRLVLPALALKRTMDLAKEGASDALQLPDDPSTGVVRWMSQAEMQFTVTPELKLETGLHDLEVTNPDGRTATLQGALLAVPKPQLTSLSRGSACSELENALTLNGDFFIKVGASQPTVTVGTSTFAPTLSGCRALPGEGGFEACTSATITIPANTFAPGSYPVTLKNPAPVDCQSSDVVNLVIAPPPTISSVAPSVVCADRATLTLQGTGFQTDATVSLDSVNALSVAVSNQGQTAVAGFDGGLTPGGPYAVTLTNPDACSATSAATVNVVPAPQLFFVDPSVVYNGISVQATVYGTGFTGAVQGVSITSSAGGAPIALNFTYDPARPNQVQVIIPAGTPAGSYAMDLSDTTECAAHLAGAITVVSQTTLTLGNPAMIPAFGWVGENTGVSIQGAGFTQVPRVYLNPTIPSSTTVATAVGAVSFLNGTKLSALVPSTALPVDSYDLIVVNPDGKVGLATGAFSVKQLAPPTITSLSPGAVSNSSSETFSVVGADFRSPTVSLSCIDSGGAALATNPTATVTGTPTATGITVSFDASTGAVACVVRVTNGDNATYTDFSALVISNPAQNLYAATAGPNMIDARKGHVLLPGNATSAARFLHAIGGAGADGGLHDSVESAPLDLFGTPSAFQPQRYRLNQPRTHIAGAQVGRYLYVAGGSDGGTALDTVERAVVLDPDARQQISDIVLEADKTGQGLDAGVWYYRIAAVMKPTDPFNKNGENLPSDPFPVQLPDLGTTKLKVKLSWRLDDGAAKYRVYRSPAAGAMVGTEQVIAETADGTVTSFTDTGLAPILAQNPLPVGSTGAWEVLPQKLSVAREGAGVSWGADPSDPTKAYLYVIGGRSGAGAALASYELLPITVGSGGAHSTSAFVAGTNALATARWQLGAARATHALTPRVASGSTYIYALSGLATNNTSVGETSAALVQAGGQLAAWSAPNSSPLGRAGYQAIIAGNFLFVFGGQNASPDTGIVGSEICGTGAQGACGTQSPPLVNNWNTGQSMLVGRHLHAGALSGAFIYITGGATNAAPASRSTEYRLW